MALLIDIEGIDGAGKGTQSARLCDHLRNLGYRVQVVSFPRYRETSFGSKVADFLNGRFGQLSQVNPFLAALLYAGDRFESKGWLQTIIDCHDVVIFDRYVSSNMAHQASKLQGAERAELIDWIKHVEFELNGLPRPDLCVLLDITPEVAQQMIQKKAPRNYTQQAADIQEADRNHLVHAREVYLDLARSEPCWATIDCLQEGQMQTVEQIAGQIWNLVRPALPLQTGA